MEGLISFFDKCDNIEEINNLNFIKYMQSRETIKNMDLSNRYSSNIYNINLTNSLKKGLSIDDVIDTIKKSQEAVLNYPLSERNIVFVNNKISDIVNDIVSEGIEASINKLKDLLGLQFYGQESISKALEYHLSKNENYKKEEGVFEYLKKQLYLCNENINNVCNLFESTYESSGIEGIEHLLNNYEEILNREITNNRIKIYDTHIPYCYNDEFHPIVNGINSIKLSIIYKALAKLHGKEFDKYCYDPDKNIVNLYKEKVIKTI